MKTDNNILGFSLIELMIVVALLAFFLLMATPSIQVYLENSKVRNVPESIEKGMQIARFNAIKTNHLTQFVLTETGGTGSVHNGWVVREEIPAAIPTNPATAVTVETFVWGVGGKNWITVNAAATDSSGDIANAVTFNGMGQLVPNSSWTASVTLNALANSITQIAVTSSTGMAGVVPLRVSVGTRGIRVCDPNLSFPATDPKRC